MEVVTNDIYESSFLLSSGGHLSDVWLNGGRSRKNNVVFSVEGEKSLLEDQKAYHQGAGTVNITEYLHHLNHLRDCIRRATKSVSRAKERLEVELHNA